MKMSTHSPGNTPKPVQEQPVHAKQGPVQVSASAMNVGGPVAMEANAPSVDLFAEFPSGTDGFKLDPETKRLAQGELENRAMADFKAALGKVVEAKCLMGYVGSDSVEIYPSGLNLGGGPRQTQGIADAPLFRVRVIDTPEGDIKHWNDDFLDPYWNVELAEPHPAVPEGLRSMWVDGPSHPIHDERLEAERKALKMTFVRPENPATFNFRELPEGSYVALDKNSDGDARLYASFKHWDAARAVEHLRQSGLLPQLSHEGGASPCVVGGSDRRLIAADMLHDQLAEMVNYMEDQALKDLLFGFTVEDVHCDLGAYEAAKAGGDLDLAVKIAGRHAEYLDAWNGLTDDRSMAEAEFGFTNEDMARAVQDFRHALGVPKTTEEVRAWLKNVMIPSVMDGDPATMSGGEIEEFWNKRWKGLVEKAETLNPTAGEVEDAQRWASQMRDHTKTWNLTPAQLVLYIHPIKGTVEKLAAEGRIRKPGAAGGQVAPPPIQGAPPAIVPGPKSGLEAVTAIRQALADAGNLSPEEKERRFGFFYFDLSEALSKFDEVERRAGSMVLKCSHESASMTGGSGGEHTLQRTAENRSEWLNRITTHWAGYLENNGAAMMRVPED